MSTASAGMAGPEAVVPRGADPRPPQRGRVAPRTLGREITDRDRNAVTLTEFLLARIAEDEDASVTVHWARCALLTSASGCSCHYPSNIIRDCTAKRVLIDWIETRAAFHDMSRTLVGAGFDMLKLLAARYADHPAYLLEWKP